MNIGIINQTPGEERKGRRLSREVAALLLCACLLPSLVLTVVGGYALTQGLVKERLQDMSEVVDETTMDMDDFFQEMREDGQIAVNLGGVGMLFDAVQKRPSSNGVTYDRTWAANYLSGELAALLAGRRMYESLQFFADSGDLLVSLRLAEGRVQSVLPSGAQQDAASVREPAAVARRMPLMNAQMAGDLPTAMINVFVPAQDRFGIRQGTLVLRVQPKAVQDVISRHHLDDGGAILLADNEGRVIRALGEQAAQSANLSQLLGNDWRRVITAKPGMEDDFHGMMLVHATVVWDPGRGQYWKVIAVIPRDAALAPYHSVLMTAAGLAALAALLMMAVVLWFGRKRLTGPFTVLLDAMGRFHGGDQAARVGSLPGDWNHLGDAFNSVAAGVASVRQNLESLVEERTRALEDEAHERERAQNMLADALDSMQEGFTVFDRDDKLVVFNTQARVMAGTQANALVPGVTFEDLARRLAHAGFVTSAVGREEQWVAERLSRHRQAQSWTEEYTADGRWIEMREWRTADGGTVSIRIDVTDRKRVERALRDSERRFRLLVETMSEGLIVTDRDRVITYVNQRYALLTGQAQDALLGRTLEAAFHPEYRGQIANRSYDIGNGEIEPYEAALETTGGTRVNVLVSPAPILDGAGQLIGKMNVVTDITVLKRTQEALKESESRFRALFEEAPFGMLLLAGDGHLIEANRAILRILQRMGQELRGTALPFPVLADALEAARVGEGPSFWEGPVPLEDGSAPWLRVHCAQVVDPFTHDVNQIATVEDISERKQVEGRMAHSSKLMILGELSAGLAHEITQPLNVIRLTSEATLARIDDNSVTLPEARAKLQVINEQADRLFDVIDYMQAFSRRESEQRQYFDLFASIRAAVALVDESFRQRRVVIDLLIADGTCVLMGHPRQLEQVILNLLTNARDAVIQANGSDGGSIQITAWRDTEHQMARVRVDDQGTGIASGDLRRIFEPFFSTKGPGKGTGLGLSISFGIINSMGGIMDATNRPGGGASFSLQIPIAQTPAGGCAPLPPPEQDPQAPAVEPRKAHIMVVEDETLAAEEMADYLGRSGYRVSTYSGGYAALNGFAKDPADLIITDLNMPDGDGRDLIDGLLEDYPFLPIIVVTGRAMTKGEDMAEVGEGADVVLRKPIRLRTLADHVARLLA